MSKDKGVLKRVVVTPDKHAPLEDKAAINVVKKAIEIIKPDAYIDLGDVGEWGSVSHWQWKAKKKPLYCLHKVFFYFLNNQHHSNLKYFLLLQFYL